MKEKKNIERLFREKFKDFEMQAPENSWNEIQKGLLPKKEKKKRVIPFWLRLSGVASALLIGFFIFNNEFGNDNINSNSNVNNNGNDNINDNSDGNINNNSHLTNSESYQENDDLNNRNSQEVVLQNIDSEELQKQTGRANEDKIIIKQADNLMADSEKNTNSEANPDFIVSSDNKKQNALAETEISVEERHLETPKSNTTNDKKEEFFVDIADIPNEEKKDLLEEIRLAQEEDENNKYEDNEFQSFNKWKITPNIAPVVMNSFSEGSPISDKFAGNSKDFQTSLSYGLGLDYALTQKLSIRTGINKLSTGYNTNDVVVYASVSRVEMLENSVNINFTGYDKGLIIAPENSAIVNSTMKTSDIGYINQTMGFIEVPLELSYKLLDSKFGIKIIGGMSTLFLQENEVYVVTNGMRTALGEANNLNDVHFSTNLGVGFRYEIFKSFDINVDPMFKYQLGTFDKNSGNFRPFLLGVYTGLSFKF